MKFDCGDKFIYLIKLCTTIERVELPSMVLYQNHSRTLRTTTYSSLFSLFYSKTMKMEDIPVTEHHGNCLTLEDLLQEQKC